MAEQDQGAAQQQGGQFAIQKVYLKDVSFESPAAPQIFSGEWKPNVNLNLNTEIKSLAENQYDVTLRMTVTVTNGDNTAFLIEIHQAGIFLIAGVPEQQLAGMLNVYCPGVLFPYARSLAANLASQGGFPSIELQPVNFEAMYMQHLQQQQAGAEGNATEH